MEFTARKCTFLVLHAHTVFCGVYRQNVYYSSFTCIYCISWSLQPEGVFSVVAGFCRLGRNCAHKLYRRQPDKANNLLLYQGGDCPLRLRGGGDAYESDRDPSPIYSDVADSGDDWGAEEHDPATDGQCHAEPATSEMVGAGASSSSQAGQDTATDGQGTGHGEPGPSEMAGGCDAAVRGRIPQAENLFKQNVFDMAKLAAVELGVGIAADELWWVVWSVFEEAGPYQGWDALSLRDRVVDELFRQWDAP